MLEELIINRLIDCLPKGIFILNIEPLSTIQESMKTASLQPFPAVHVLEREFHISKQIFKGNQAQFSLNKSVWVIIVVKNTYDLNDVKPARFEIEELRSKVMQALSYWNPQMKPFFMPLVWNTEPVEIYYEASLGIMHCPMIIKPSIHYVETYELCQTPAL